MHKKPAATIAILFRRDEKPRDIEGYAIHGMLEYWRHHGIGVVPVFGPARKAVTAQLLFVHVNLSVVPQHYLDYAQLYPRTLNARIHDIRKTTVCDHLVQPDDGYQGPVVVKSNLNAAGAPEQNARNRLIRKVAKSLQQLAPPAVSIYRQEDYRVYTSISDVPAGVFRDPRLIAQKFRPELEGGLYHVRSYSFLGDRYSCMRAAATEPVVHLRNTVQVEAIEPHPEIVALRHQLKMDYGKLDYTLHQGQPVLLDVNKTLGAQRGERNPVVLAMRKERAKGIFPYLDLQAPND